MVTTSRILSSAGRFRQHERLLSTLVQKNVKATAGSSVTLPEYGAERPAARPEFLTTASRQMSTAVSAPRHFARKDDLCSGVVSLTLESRIIQQRRWKHASKMGNHLKRLDDLAHEKSRQEAQEKRQKKKDKKAARKSKKGKHNKAEPTKEAVSEMPSIDDEEYVIEEEDHHEDDDEDDEDDDNLLPDAKKVQARMQKIVDRFKDSLKAIRGAEPTVELFDNVQVEAYGGAATSLQSVAQVVLVSPTRATATCFDPAVAKSVQLALYDQLELHCTIAPDDPGAVQISLPRVSLESRKKTAHALQKRAEAVRQRVRQVRRKVLTPVKQGVAGKLEHVSKDDAFRVQQDIEATTDKVLQDLNKAAEEKHNSIMAVDS